MNSDDAIGVVWSVLGRTLDAEDLYAPAPPSDVEIPLIYQEIQRGSLT